MKSHLRHIALLLLFSVFSAVFSQTQMDFQDKYDYNLKNFEEKEMGYEYEEYSLPREFQKPALVSPRKPEPAKAISIPGFNPAQFGPQGQAKALFNPYDLTANYDLYLRKEKEKKEKDKAFEEKIKYLRTQKYSETKARRFTIIFFLTFPFVAALSYGVATAGKFQKTAEGSAFVGISAIGLSALNAWQDQRATYAETSLKNLPQMNFTLAEKKF